MPLIAIITRTLGRPLLLARAAASVTGQNFQDFTWIVVNDGGDPAEVDEALKGFLPLLQGRLQRLDHPTPIGRTAASNAGLRACDSRYVVFHDDDDTWEPTFLEATTTALASRPNPLFRMAVTYATAIQERIEGSQIQEVSRHSLNSDLRELRLADFLREDRTPNLSFLYERSVHDILGPYDESLDALEDWEFLLRYYRKFEALLIRKALANYHFRPGSSPGLYANSATGNVDLHGLHHQILWNRLLRKDLDDGQIGIGILGGMLQAMNESAQPFLRLADFAQVAVQIRKDGFRKAVICGAGLPGRQAATAARLAGLSPLGFTDRDPNLVGSQIEGLPVMTPEDGLRLETACLIGSLNRGAEIAQDLRNLASSLGLPAPHLYSPSTVR